MSKKKPEPTVILEAVEPEGIAYHFGEHSCWLTGFDAWLYRGMIWMYGEAVAAARFWALNGGSVSRQEDAAATPFQGFM